MGPILGDDKQWSSRHLLHVFYPLFIEPRGNMFHRIQTKTVAAGLLQHPARPVFKFFGHRVVAKINIFTHQVIKVAHFVVNLIVPAFTGIVVNDFENTVFIRVFNMVDTAKALVIPDKLRIFPLTDRKVVASPRFTVDDFLVNLSAILRVDPLYADAFFFIRPHFVVNDYVHQHRNVVLLQCGNRLQQLSFITILGGDRAFLVKLPQVKQIVAVIADGIAAGCSFSGRRQPNHIDANFIQVRG